MDDKREEFLHLRKGELTMAEYGKKLIELAKYSLNLVATEQERCSRFERGL